MVTYTLLDLLLSSLTRSTCFHKEFLTQSCSYTQKSQACCWKEISVSENDGYGRKKVFDRDERIPQVSTVESLKLLLGLASAQLMEYFLIKFCDIMDSGTPYLAYEPSFSSGEFGSANSIFLERIIKLHFNTLKMGTTK